MNEKELKDKASEYLEDLHISGDTMMGFDHGNIPPALEGGCLNLYDVMAGFHNHIKEIENLKDSVNKQ